MRSIAFLLLSLIAASTIVSAQPLKKRGLIVTNNSDTLQGWLGASNWGQTPDKITFWQDSSSKQGITCGVSDIEYFKIDGIGIFQRASVPILNNNVQTNTNSSDTNSTYPQEPVFLKLLVSGERLSLYELSHNYTVFYLKADGQYELLDDQEVGETRSFRIKLGQYAARYNLFDKLEVSICHAQYEQEDLSKIVVAINQNKSTKEYISSSPHKQALSWFVGFGAGSARLSQSGYDPILSGINFNYDFMTRFAAGADVINLQETNRLAFRMMVSYSQVNFKGMGILPTSSIDDITYNLKQTNISPEFSVLYHFTGIQRWRLYAGLGIVYNFSSYSGNQLRQSIPQQTTNDYLELQKGWISGDAKIGLRINTEWDVFVSGLIFGNYTAANTYSLNPRTYLANVYFHFR